MVILIVGLSLLVASGCSAGGDTDTMVGRVRPGGSTLTWQGVRVVLPDGVAPAGTKVRLHREAQTGTGAAAVAVSDGLTIDLGEGL